MKSTFVRLCAAAVAFALASLGVAGLASLATVSTASPASATSTGGPKIAYARDGVWVMNADGSGKTELAAVDARDLAVSPDGSKIAFTRSVDDGSGLWHEDLWVIGTDGSGKTKLADDADSPSWSPDSSKITYAVDAGDIWVMNADGSGKTKLADDADSPLWSPDGTKIAYLDNSNGGLWVMNPSNGSGKTKLADSVYEFSWSPNASQIAYEYFYDDNTNFHYEVWVMNASNGSGKTKLAGDAESPLWSPDGSKIAYEDANFSRLWVMNASDGSGKTQVAEDILRESWSPDGTKLAYEADTDSDGSDDELWIVGADGAGESQLGLGQFPVWFTPPGQAANSVAPSIPGTPRVDSTLTADPGTWSPDGLSFAFKWFADGVAIPSATGQAYTPTPADVGKFLKVKVTASKPGYLSTSKKSAANGPVGKASFTADEVPVIVGTKAKTVWSVNPASLDGWAPTPSTFVYSWKIGSTIVSTSATYKPGLGKIGKSVTVTVKAKRPGYVKGVNTSSPVTVTAP